ncbi:MAG: helix-turn-helix domain-containing protein [Butyrivibrio sp.]|nr:helix-turn-helix domain-containing protein [Acetatifactor muris]MCM1561029.1 helix-turn-helix domain-containing protein [Butyrivibrio sp.]
MTTGAILAQLRHEKEIGQKELAACLKVSVGTVSNYENNVHSPDLATLRRLADYFGVTTDYLLGRTTYRGNPGVLNQRLSDEYTMTDIINTVLTFDSGTVNHLMEYAKFLQARPLL